MTEQRRPTAASGLADAWASLRLEAKVAAVMAAVVVVAVVTSIAAGDLPGSALGSTLVGLLIVTAIVRRSAGSIPTRVQPDGWLAVQQEVARSRRYNRQFSLVAISAIDAPRPAGKPGRRAGTDTIAALVENELRTSDAAWVDGGTCYVLLAETGQQAAYLFVARMAHGLLDDVDRHQVRIASFPDDAVTAGGLFQALAHGEQVEQVDERASGAVG